MKRYRDAFKVTIAKLVGCFLFGNSCANKKGCHSAAFSMLSPDDQSQLNAPPV
jgi:hypothetical protein